MDLVAGLTPDAAQQLGGYTGVSLDHHTGIRTSYLSLDTLTAGPLQDRRVRQALNHAVDVPLLIKAVLGGQATEVPAMIPRGAFGFDAAVEPFTRSVAKARALLAEAGHPDGIRTTLTASNVDANVAEAIAGLLDRAGVHARVDLLDPGTYAQRLTSDNHGALGPMYLAASTVWTLDGESMIQSNVRSDRRQSRWHDERPTGSSTSRNSPSTRNPADGLLRPPAAHQDRGALRPPLPDRQHLRPQQNAPAGHRASPGVLDMASAEVSR